MIDQDILKIFSRSRPVRPSAVLKYDKTQGRGIFKLYFVSCCAHVPAPLNRQEAATFKKKKKRAFQNKLLGHFFSSRIS